MNQDERIEQFRKMAQANPDDDLAHFALGQALIDAERNAEAVNVLRHVVRINDGYSRAWVLLGNAQLALDDEAGAIQSFQTGYAAAMNRGDLMPATEMKQHLSSLGADIPTDIFVAPVEPDPDDGREPEQDEIRCARTRRIGQRMTMNPFADNVGDWIEGNISKESWEDWMEMSIKLINELRLDLGDPAAQKVYDDNMRDFLCIPAKLFEERDSQDNNA